MAEASGDVMMPVSRRLLVLACLCVWGPEPGTERGGDHTQRDNPSAPRQLKHAQYKRYASYYGG